MVGGGIDFIAPTWQDRLEGRCGILALPGSGSAEAYSLAQPLTRVPVHAE